jgi:DNA-directed RNA polymerase subunit RPC12/RpoP
MIEDLIRRLKSALGLEGGASPGVQTRAGAQRGRQRVRLVRCKQCDWRGALGTRRCPQCGAKIITAKERAEQAALEAAAATDTSSSAPAEGPQDSTAVQMRILAGSLHADDGQIHVHPQQGDDEGEVRAGTWRVYGAEAVDAVDALLHAGLVERKDATTFVLTTDGQKAASALEAKRSG